MGRDSGRPIADRASFASVGTREEREVATADARFVSAVVEQLAAWAGELEEHGEALLVRALMAAWGEHVVAPCGALQAASVELTHAGSGLQWAATLEAFLLPAIDGATLVRRRVQWILDRSDLPEEAVALLAEAAGKTVVFDIIEPLPSGDA